MRKDYEKLFTNIKPSEPPAGLLNKIMARIHEEEQLMSIKKRLFVFLVSAVISAGALISAFNAFQADFAQSGLAQFLSLLFSDLGAVMSSWQDFGLALLESLPVMSVSAFLFALLVFLWSFKHFAQAVKVVLDQSRLLKS